VFYNILQRYTFKELLKSFLMTVIILTGIFFLVGSLQMIRKYSTYITFLDIIVLSPLMMGNALAFTIPMSMLATTTLFYGRMAQEREFLILRVAGIHSKKIFQSAFCIGGFLCIICFYLNAELMPLASRKQSELKYKAIEVLLNATFSSQETSITYIPNLLIRYKSLENGFFQNLIIHHLDNKKIQNEILATSGRLTYDKRRSLLTFHLKDGIITHFSNSIRDENKENRFTFQEFTLPIPLDSKQKKDVMKVKYKSFHDLMVWMDTWKEFIPKLRVLLQEIEQEEDGHWEDFLERNNDVLKKYFKMYYADKSSPKKKFEKFIEKESLIDNIKYSCTVWNDHQWRWHNRIAMGLAPLLVVFLGSSLGLLIHHSNRLFAFGVSALPVMLIYYPLQMLGESLTDNYILSPWLGAWLGTIVTGILGIVLLGIVYRK